MNRRDFLKIAAVALAAPAIVKAANIMPVRNRLILPSSPYTKETVYTFSCYLKPTSPTPDISLFPAPEDGCYTSISDAGNGWYRYTRTFTPNERGRAVIELPVPQCWAPQLEWKGDRQCEIALKGPDGDGILVLPSTYSGLAQT